MKRRKTWIVLTLALVTGAIAGYLALDFMRSKTVAAVASSPATTEVVVAARDLAAGAIVQPLDVKSVPWPAEAAAPTYVRSVDQVVGRGLVVPVSADEPLMTTKLAGRDEGGGLPIVIPDGMRAVSVKVDEVIGVAGFVLPGTRVDVLVTMNPTNDREEATSKVILQNIETLAAGQVTERDASGKPQNVPVITLLVTPEQAEALTLASTEGRIHLALRNMRDQREIRTVGTKAGRLVAPDGAPVNPEPRRTSAAPRRPGGNSVVTYNGTERTVTTFPAESGNQR